MDIQTLITRMETIITKIYTIAAAHGIPAPAVNAAFAFLGVIVLGKPLISLSLRTTFRDVQKLSQETLSSYTGVPFLAAVAIVPLATLLSPIVGVLSAAGTLVIFPAIVGMLAKKGVYKGIAEDVAVKKEEPEKLEDVLRRKRPEKEKSMTKVGEALERKKTHVNEEKKINTQDLKKTGEGRSKKKAINVLGFFKKKKKAKAKRKDAQAETRKVSAGGTLVVEEIKVPPVQTPAQKPPAQIRRTRQAAQPQIQMHVPPLKSQKKGVETSTPQLPPADKLKRDTFLKAVAELESLVYGGQAPSAQAGMPKMEQKTAPPPEAKQGTKQANKPTTPKGVEKKYVEQVAKVVEEKVVQSRKHKFITWREALEMRKQARAAVQKMRPVVEKKVKETLEKKGTITKEDLDAIAEEIFYQVQKGNVFERESTVTSGMPGLEEFRETKEEHRPRKKRRGERKKEEKQEKSEDEEDILALLGGGEEGTETMEEESDEFEELKKLLES